MTVLLAALDDSAAARPVLEVALRMAPYVGADVVAVHVAEDGSGRTARAAAAAFDVPLLVRRGEVATELGSAQHELHALAIVVGARRIPGGARPAGHVALRLMQELATAVVVVPPDATDRALRRVLVAVEGDGESEALVALVSQLREAEEAEVVALHVFEPGSLPMFGDEPVLEAEAWASEFLRRVSSLAVDDLRLEVRVGDAAEVVPASAEELDVDFIVMSWNCNLDGGHGAIVRHVLESARVPVLLLPVGREQLLASRATQDA